MEETITTQVNDTNHRNKPICQMAKSRNKKEVAQERIGAGPVATEKNRGHGAFPAAKRTIRR